MGPLGLSKRQLPVRLFVQLSQPTRGGEGVQPGSVRGGAETVARRAPATAGLCAGAWQRFCGRARPRRGVGRLSAHVGARSKGGLPGRAGTPATWGHGEGVGESWLASIIVYIM